MVLDADLALAVAILILQNLPRSRAGSQECNKQCLTVLTCTGTTDLRLLAVIPPAASPPPSSPEPFESMSLRLSIQSTPFGSKTPEFCINDCITANIDRSANWVPRDKNIIANDMSKLGTDNVTARTQPGDVVTTQPWVRTLLDSSFITHSIKAVSHKAMYQVNTLLLLLILPALS